MLTRREFLQSTALGAVAVAIPRMPVALKGTAFNHISYQSVDYNKTRDFYVDLLGFQASDEDDKQLYIWAGNQLISAKNTPRVMQPLMDHIGITVEPFDAPAVKAALQERGLRATMSTNDPHDPGKSVFTRDPFNYNVQLGAPDLEAKPAPVDSHSPLKAVGINHISYQCADYTKARDFYKNLLSARISNDDGKQAYVWFGDVYIVVRNSPASPPPATSVVDHFGWTIADWNVQHVVEVLKQRGLQANPDAAGKSVMTKDLNGYSLQLCSKDL